MEGNVLSRTAETVKTTKTVMTSLKLNPPFRHPEIKAFCHSRELSGIAALSNGNVTVT